MRVMVIGASRDREKFGNKAVRAYQRQGHTVLPVNPHADQIEGVKCFAAIGDVPGPIDRATIYLPPEVGIDTLDELATRNDVEEVWLNPGSESPELIDKARSLGLKVIQACSIVDIGASPGAL